MSARRTAGFTAAAITIAAGSLLAAPASAFAAPAGPDLVVKQGPFDCTASVTNTGGAVARGVQVYSTNNFGAFTQPGDIAPGASVTVNFFACRFTPWSVAVLATTANGDADWTNNVALVR